MPVMVTRVDDRDRVVITITDELDVTELLALLGRIASGSSGTIVIDVSHAPEVSPVALAQLKLSEFWPRIWLWGLSHNGERLLRHLCPRPEAAA